jgi:hypothetical protein
MKLVGNIIITLIACSVINYIIYRNSTIKVVSVK